jgi:hypothetical protein
MEAVRATRAASPTQQTNTSGSSVDVNLDDQIVLITQHFLRQDKKLKVDAYWEKVSGDLITLGQTNEKIDEIRARFFANVEVANGGEGEAIVPRSKKAAARNLARAERREAAAKALAVEKARKLSVKNEHERRRLENIEKEAKKARLRKLEGESAAEKIRKGAKSKALADAARKTRKKREARFEIFKAARAEEIKREHELREMKAKQRKMRAKGVK